MLHAPRDMGTLYLVATPIGNLEDITARALRILGEVALVAAEDTRRTRKLLTHFGISKPLLSYFEHNKLARLDRALRALAEGDVALVSDAGVPGLSDPGYELVRAALAAGHRVTPVPGPSAVLAALTASGLPTESFTFVGYLPRRAAERRRFLRSLRAEPRTLVMFEAPHRLMDALADLQTELGERPLTVARELTKLHEEIFRGTASEALEHFRQHPPRGEITLVLGGAPNTDAKLLWDESRIRALVDELVEAGLSRTEAVKQAAARSGWSRKEIYRLAQRHYSG